MVNLISLLAGTGFLLFALMDANRSWKANSDRSIKRNWLMIICFIILFFWGDVICYMNLAYRSQAPYLNTIVSQVFLWGSAFVFITLRLFNEAVNQAVNSKKRIREIEEWKSTFDAVSDLILIQNRDFTITNLNKAMARALGAKPEEIIGRKCYEVLHKAGHPWPNCPFEKTRHDDQYHSEEVEDPNLKIPLLVSTSPIFNETGALTGSVHIARDISAQKKAETEVKLKMAEIEKQNRLMVDREKRIIEIKEEVNALLKELGRPEKYLG